MHITHLLFGSDIVVPSCTSILPSNKTRTRTQLTWSLLFHDVISILQLFRALNGKICTDAVVKNSSYKYWGNQPNKIQNRSLSDDYIIIIVYSPASGREIKQKC